MLAAVICSAIAVTNHMDDWHGRECLLAAPLGETILMGYPAIKQVWYK